MQPWRISAGLTAAIAGAALVLAEDRVGYLAPLWPVILADHGISIAVNLALVLATVAAAIYIVARVSPGAWISPSAPSGGARGNPALASQLIQESCLKQGHPARDADPALRPRLADLGITRSLGRPRVSDDNPFSEAHFKTVKYHPGFPDRFPDIHAAVDFCRSFFPWYNNDHRHGGIAMLTPPMSIQCRADEVLTQRERTRTLRNAWAQHPERFVHGIPKPLPTGGLDQSTRCGPDTAARSLIYDSRVSHSCRQVPTETGCCPPYLSREQDTGRDTLLSQLLRR